MVHLAPAGDGNSPGAPSLRPRRPTSTPEKLLCPGGWALSKPVRESTRINILKSALLSRPVGASRPTVRGRSHTSQDLTNVTAGADLSLDDTGLRDHALVAFPVSTGCRISEALAVDRAAWGGDRVVVRGKGDVERTVVITDRTREITNRYLAARTDDAPALFISLSPGRAGRRLSVRGAEAICTRIGLRNKVSGGLHPHRFRHTAGTIVQEEIGGPPPHRGIPGPPRTRLGRWLHRDQQTTPRPGRRRSPRPRRVGPRTYLMSI
ncbi:MAG: site-specific integrase [Mycobacteriales bacterium]|nr:MAG: hypothetical protein DLM56_04555 [Pseudonocardiales bacterium]